MIGEVDICRIEQLSGPTQAIRHSVYDALWPYYPGRIDVYADFDLDYNMHRIQTVASNFRKMSHVFRIEMDDILEMDTVWDLVDRICESAFEHYRNLPRTEPEANIVLGEN